ncbi:hypothetical protein U1Q18_017201, partial [Sarracenia purpurea var. burkii]
MELGLDIKLGMKGVVRGYWGLGFGKQNGDERGGFGYSGLLQMTVGSSGGFCRWRDGIGARRR